MAPKKKDAAPKAAEAQKDPFASGLDPKAEAGFIREYAAVKAAETDLAGRRGELAQIYKRLEQLGFSKEHVAFAKGLEKRNVAEVIADFEMKIKICRMMGHAAGRQLDMLDKDRTPLEEQAYGDGFSAGKFGRGGANPYGMETIAGQRWQQGLNDGNAFRNQALNEAVNGPGAGGAEIIKGAGTDEGDGGDDTDGSGSDTDDDSGDTGDGDADTGDADADAEIPGEKPLEASSSDDDDWDRADPANRMPA